MIILDRESCHLRLILTVIFFDLDNTLVDRFETVVAYADVFRRDFSSALQDSVTTPMLAEAFNRLDKGGYSTHEIRSREIAALPIWLHPVEPKTLLDHWQNWVPFNPVAKAGLSEVLTLLKQDQYRLCLVSNGTSRNQRAKLQNLGIEDYFEQVIISEEVNVKKPHIDIFNLSLQLMGCTAQESLFVGDHPVNDVWGAEQAGMLPVWFSGSITWPDDQPQPQHSIRSLDELPALLNLNL